MVKHLIPGMQNIYVGALIESDLTELIHKLKPSKIAVLTDEHTYELCLPFVMNSVGGLETAEIIQLEAGESTKDIEIAAHLYSLLSDFEFGRGDLLINLGGGMISDLGGFVAATYKRGMKFINIPTTLLGMIDAALGGKNGINLGPLKNQIGTITFPEKVYIDPVFLSTLPELDLLNGFAEVIKHGLIASETLFDELVDLNLKELSPEILLKIASVKLKIVEQDPNEQGQRKTLNFGHTFGHALEGALMKEHAISHGHAVAVGMLVESKLSFDRGIMEEEDWSKIHAFLMKYYTIPEMTGEERMYFKQLLKNDKKNRNAKILSCLLTSIGSCIYDQEVEAEDFLRIYDELKASF